MQRIAEIKSEAGTHSPSLFTLLDRIPEIKIEVDACFLSNPYATDLFVSRLEKDLIKTGKLRDVLEFYPSQNNHIASILSKAINIPADQLFVCNGGIEAIQACMHRFAGDKVAIILPTFSPYYEYTRPDQEVIFYQLDPEKDFAFDVHDFAYFVLKNRADTVCIINPNNPNGGYINSADMTYLLEAFKDLKLVVLDESFIDFAYEDEALSRKSLAQKASTMSNVVLVKSMSKDFGIAGIRAGYAVMNPVRLRTLLGNGYVWNVSGLTEFFFHLFAEEAFQKEYETARLRYLEEARTFFAELKKVPRIRTFTSKANFSLIQLPDDIPVDEFVLLMLLRHGVYIRNCSDKKGLESGKFVRIASRKESENTVLLKALKDVIASF